MMDVVLSSVSRETTTRLEKFAALVEKWTARIGLVSKRDAGRLWERHIEDSIQLGKWLPDHDARWLDIGSGGGFPALVVGILAKERSQHLDLILVESDKRKAAFLRVAVRELELEACVLDRRIEDLTGINADVISIRAMAPLVDLLPHVAKHLDRDGFAILPKGAQWREEVELARAHAQFNLKAVPSDGDPQSVILEIGDIRND